MELQEIPAPVPDSEPNLTQASEKLDRIAFELWQHGSLPEAAVASENEIEEVAGHASCL